MEARWLIGFWLNSGSAQPKRTMSRGALIPRARSSYWGEHARIRIASQLRHIRHWTVEQRPFEELPDLTATWFIDPPYMAAGKHYKYNAVNYTKLGEWCQSREGQVVACEAMGAEWLPFRPLADIQSFSKSRSPEAIWTND